MLTRKMLSELLRYEPLTGAFTWLQRRSNVAAGAAAGSLDKQGGYVRIYVFNRNYHAHRLAWLLMTGAFPDGELDHIDMNRSNNSWSNLRLATRSQNIANSIARRNNKSGMKGIYCRRDTSKWSASIFKDGRKITLGCFYTREEASAAYAIAAKRLYGEFARAV